MAPVKQSNTYCVIGLGRFGTSLALKLAEYGQEVLALDKDEEKVKQVQDKVSQAFVVSHMDKAALQEAGIQNCGTVIVSIGENIEASILITLNVIEMGVKRVISKAISADHGKVLSKIGAEVVYPEQDQAYRLARSLLSPGSMDFIDLPGQFTVAEIKLTFKLHGQTIVDIGFRQKYRLNIIAVIHKGETIVEIDPEYMLRAGDAIVVVGARESIAQFEKFLAS